MTKDEAIRDAVVELMRYQWSHSREAMHALQCLIDAADEAADEIERLRAALAESEQEQKPVAWMVTNIDGSDCYVTADRTLAMDAQRALPLYTGPVTSEETRTCTCHPDDNPPRPCPQKYALSECRKAALSAPAAEPLTDEDIKSLVQKAMSYYGFDPRKYGYAASAGFIVLARAVERKVKGKS